MSSEPPGAHSARGAELTGVPRTALFTLRSRADEHRKGDRGVLHDPWAATWLDRLGWPSGMNQYYSDWIQAKNALRAARIDRVLRLLEPSAVVELGCGLSSRRQRLADLGGAWFDVDLPSIAALREDLNAQEEGQLLLPGSALDDGWVETVRSTLGGATRHLTIVAEGLVYYLPEEAFRAALQRWHERLPGATLVFDVIGRLDFEAARGYSQRIEAGILWAGPVPLERAPTSFGLEALPDTLEAEIRKTELDGSPAWWRGLAVAFRRFGFLHDRRSGLVVGRLPDRE